MSDFVICHTCHRCGCGAGPFPRDSEAEMAHEDMHDGQRPPAVEQVNVEPADPGIGTGTLMRILLPEDGMGDAETIITDLFQYAEHLHELVRWFALAYLNKEPTWMMHDQYGNELADNLRLAATWRAVMGGGEVTRADVEELRPD